MGDLFFIHGLFFVSLPYKQQYNSSINSKNSNSMMTVKIISTETSGKGIVNLFPAARVNYCINLLNELYLYLPGEPEVPRQTFDDLVKKNNPEYVVSSLSNPASSQNMQVAWIRLYDEDGNISPLLISAPAQCYIMSEGKTVDQFRLDFLE